MCSTCKNKANSPNLNDNTSQPIMAPMNLPNSPDTTNMLTYITSLGWQYNGDCGCKNNYATYINYTDPKFSNFRIWLPKSPKPLNNMQIRKAQNRNTFIYASAGLMNWIQIYEQTFNN